MSYDISFKAKVENFDYYVTVGHCEANTTWNVREMICKSTGLDWKNCQNNGLCKDVMPKIEAGYNELTFNPYKYKKYEAANGWGTVESTRDFFKQILDDWKDTIRFDNEIEEFATFWIE